MATRCGSSACSGGISETKVRRRGFGEDGIYLDAARDRYMGAISLGYEPDGKPIRRKVSGQAEQEVRFTLGQDWAPREMRHTFVSVLSANGVPVESIALLAGHDRTATT